MRTAVVIAAALAATASGYSVRSLKTLYRGLHETSVEDVFDGGLVKAAGVKDPAPALEKAWSSGLSASVAAATKKTADCASLTTKGKISACAKPVVDAMAKGAAEPDNAACPNTYNGASMTSQTLWAPYAAVNPLGPCRSGIQPYHGSPPQLVRIDALKKTVLGDKRHVDADGLVTLPRITDKDNRLQNKPMAASIDNMQWRSNLVARIAHLAAVAALVPSPVAGAKKLGAAFHVLGDSFSASHVQRFDDPVAAEAAVAGTSDKAYAGPIDGSKDHYYGSIEACSAGLAVDQSFSMDVVRWMKHFAADVDKGSKKSIHAARLYRCMELFLERIIEEWMTVRAEGSGGAGAPGGVHHLSAIGKAVSKLVDKKRLSRSNTAVVHPADHTGVSAMATLDRVNRYVDTVIDIACAALRFPGELEGKAVDRLHEPAGGANKEFSSATTKHFHPARSMQPAGVMAEADFVEQRNLWDEEIQVLRDSTKASKQRNVPARYWLPNRGQDACALPHAHIHDDHVDVVKAGEKDHADHSHAGEKDHAGHSHAGEKDHAGHSHAGEKDHAHHDAAGHHDASGHHDAAHIQETNTFRQHLLVTPEEFAEWSTVKFQDQFDKDGGYLLPPRAFMLEDLKPALTDRKSGRYTLAANRIGAHVKALKEYAKLTEEEKKHASKEEIAAMAKVEADEPDTHGTV